MQKYWKTIAIAALIVISSIVFIVMGLKSNTSQLFTYENIEGKPAALENIEIEGDLYDGLSISQPFKLYADGNMHYLKDNKLGEKSMGYFLPNKLKKMISEEKNFMRSKEFYSEDYFYNNQDYMLYANMPMNWLGYASDALEISVLNKKNKGVHQFKLETPDIKPNFGFDVVGVFPSDNENIVVFTQEYHEDGQDGVHAYLVNTEKETIVKDFEWQLENDVESDAYHEIKILSDDKNKKLLIAEQISEYDEDIDQETKELGKVVVYDLEANQTENISLPESIELLVHFDGDYIYGASIQDQKVAMNKVTRDGKNIERTNIIDFELPLNENNSYELMTNADEQQLYLLMSNENNEGPVGIAAMKVDKLSTAYIGKIDLKNSDHEHERYEYYINHIELK